MGRRFEYNVSSSMLACVYSSRRHVAHPAYAGLFLIHSRWTDSSRKGLQHAKVPNFRVEEHKEPRFLTYSPGNALGWLRALFATLLFHCRVRTAATVGVYTQAVCVREPVWVISYSYAGAQFPDG